MNEGGLDSGLPNIQEGSDQKDNVYRLPVKLSVAEYPLRGAGYGFLAKAHIIQPDNAETNKSVQEFLESEKPTNFIKSIIDSKSLIEFSSSSSQFAYFLKAFGSQKEDLMSLEKVFKEKKSPAIFNFEEMLSALYIVKTLDPNRLETFIGEFSTESDRLKEVFDRHCDHIKQNDLDLNLDTYARSDSLIEEDRYLSVLASVASAAALRGELGDISIPEYKINAEIWHKMVKALEVIPKKIELDRERSYRNFRGEHGNVSSGDTIKKMYTLAAAMKIISLQNPSSVSSVHPDTSK